MQRYGQNPPGVLLTDYMVPEHLLTRGSQDTDRKSIKHCHTLFFLVPDELHTHRNRQSTAVVLLFCSLRFANHSDNMLFVISSAIMSTDKNAYEEENVAANLFDADFAMVNIIEECPERITDNTVADVSRPVLPSLTDYSEKLAVENAITWTDAKRIPQHFLRAACSVGTGYSHSRIHTAPLHQLPVSRRRFAAPFPVSFSARAFIPTAFVRKPGARSSNSHFCRECRRAHIPAWFNS